MEGKKLSALIDYDFIVNTEFGLIRFIREFFQDEDVFDLNVLNKSDREILSLLYSRTHYNPLSIIMKKIMKTDEEHEKYMKMVYDGYFNEYKKEIIEASVTSESILNFVRLMLGSKVNNTSICIKDDIEQSNIKACFGKCNTVKISDIPYIKSFDVFYVKDYKFFTDNNLKLNGKNLYFTNRKYNLLFLKNNPSYFHNDGITIMGKYHIKGENING